MRLGEVDAPCRLVEGRLEREALLLPGGEDGRRLLLSLCVLAARRHLLDAAVDGRLVGALGLLLRASLGRALLWALVDVLLRMCGCLLEVGGRG